MEALESERAEKEAHVERLQRTTREQLWSEDLDGFEAAYAAWLADAERSLAELADHQRKAKARNAKKGERLRCLWCMAAQFGASSGSHSGSGSDSARVCRQGGGEKAREEAQARVRRH